MVDRVVGGWFCAASCAEDDDCAHRSDNAGRSGPDAGATVPAEFWRRRTSCTHRAWQLLCFSRQSRVERVLALFIAA